MPSSTTTGRGEPWSLSLHETESENDETAAASQMVRRRPTGFCCWRKNYIRHHAVYVIHGPSAPTRHPSLGQNAPFPYGDAPLPEGWWPMCHFPTYLSVPGMFPNHIYPPRRRLGFLTGARRDKIVPSVDVEDSNSNGEDTRRLSLIRQMENRRGRTISLAFCVFLRVLLSIFLYAFLFATWILRWSRIGNGFNTGVVFLLVFYVYLPLLVLELPPINAFWALLLAEFVAVQDLHGVIQPYIEASPTVTFSCWTNIEGDRCNESYRDWSFDYCERASPENTRDVLDQISTLCVHNYFVMIRLQLGTRLANHCTMGQALTDLHQFYLDYPQQRTREIQLSWTLPDGETVSPTPRNIVVTRTGRRPNFLLVARLLYFVAVPLCLTWALKLVLLVLVPRLRRTLKMYRYDLRCVSHLVCRTPEARL